MFFTALSYILYVLELCCVVLYCIINDNCKLSLPIVLFKPDTYVGKVKVEM